MTISAHPGGYTGEQAKAQAAVKWTSSANLHAAENGGKPWTYALIPDDQVMGSSTLERAHRPGSLSYEFVAMYRQEDREP